MRKLFAILILAASVAAPASAFARPISDFEAILDIAGRYHAGTIQNDVDRSQGRAGLNVQLVGATQEQTVALLAAHALKVEHNMKAIRNHVTCVEKPEACGNLSAKKSR